jgi:hypothetical protein
LLSVCGFPALGQRAGRRNIFLLARQFRLGSVEVNPSKFAANQVLV